MVSTPSWSFDPAEPSHCAAIIRPRAGRRLDSPALVADGAHARADAYVSLAVIASAAVVAIGRACTHLARVLIATGSSSAATTTTQAGTGPASAATATRTPSRGCARQQ